VPLLMSDAALSTDGGSTDSDGQMDLTVALKARWDNLAFGHYDNSNFPVFADNVRSALVPRGAEAMMEAEQPGDERIQRNALVRLRDAIDVDSRTLLDGYATFTEAWQALEEEYKERCQIELPSLKRSLVTTRMKFNQPADDYLKGIKLLYSKIVWGDRASCIVPMEEKEAVNYAVEGLSDEYYALKQQHYVNETYVTFAKLHQAIRRTQLAATAVDQPQLLMLTSRLERLERELAAEKRRQGVPAGGGAAGGSHTGDRAPVPCGFCQATTHWPSQCPSNPRNQRPSGATTPSGVTPVHYVNNVWLQPFETVAVEQGASETVFLDSGANYSVTSRRDILHNFVPARPGGTARFAGGTASTAVLGSGDLIIRSSRTGQVLCFRDVRLLAECDRTLVSVVRCLKSGVRFMLNRPSGGDMVVNNGVFADIKVEDQLTAIDAEVVSPTPSLSPSPSVDAPRAVQPESRHPMINSVEVQPQPPARRRARRRRARSRRRRAAQDDATYNFNASEQSRDAPRALAPARASAALQPAAHLRPAAGSCDSWPALPTTARMPPPHTPHGATATTAPTTGNLRDSFAEMGELEDDGDVDLASAAAALLAAARHELQRVSLSTRDGCAASLH
jgi:hypothetical protein